MRRSHRSRARLVSVLPVNVSDGKGNVEKAGPRAPESLVKLVARHADCCLLHLSCQHVGETCPNHHPCAQHHPGMIAMRVRKNSTTVGTLHPPRQQPKEEGAGGCLRTAKLANSILRKYNLT